MDNSQNTGVLQQDLHTQVTTQAARNVVGVPVYSHHALASVPFLFQHFGLNRHCQRMKGLECFPCRTRYLAHAQKP